VITPEEIKAKAAEFEIHTSNVQRDYIFGWFLSGLFRTSELKDTLFLKGGNALRKGYFERTRYSSDLDFGIPTGISPEKLRSEMNKVCDYVQGAAGVTFVTDDTRVEEKFSASESPLPDLKVYEVRVYFRDFTGNADHIKLKVSMDVTRFDRVMLPLQMVRLIHPYSDAPEVVCDIRCMKLEEIVATKLKCLLQRQHAPDLFDYAYSIQLMGGTLNKQEVVRAFVGKTIFGRNPHVLRRILGATAFDYFRTYWYKSLVCAKSAMMDVEDAIRLFLGDLEALFSIYPDNGTRDFAFFSADLRVPIMQAGRDQTVLRLRYKGEDRVVEPYSLKYMQRRDGREREYFYAFNRSGGSNAPGIRAFVSENVQSIENTDEKFTPQFPIELTKAGETPEDRYLFDPNRPAQAPRGLRFLLSRPVGSMKYTYRCQRCGKELTKSVQSNVLRKHNIEGGYPCPGRTGYFVRSGF